MNPKFVFPVSVGLVGCMFIHATEGLAAGKAPSEVHLITAAPVVVTQVSTASVVSMPPGAAQRDLRRGVPHRGAARERAAARRAGNLALLNAAGGAAPYLLQVYASVRRVRDDARKFF